MSTYAEIKAQIAELEQKAQEARLKELVSAKERISQLMDAHGLTFKDLGATLKASRDKARPPLPAKYRDHATGKEWTGRGRLPLWLSGKDRAEFLIK